jgi:hypothetical protein
MSEIDRINAADARCPCVFLDGSCAGECCGYGECSCTLEVLAVLRAAAQSTEDGAS